MSRTPFVFVVLLIQFTLMKILLDKNSFSCIMGLGEKDSGIIKLINTKQDAGFTSAIDSTSSDGLSLAWTSAPLSSWRHRLGDAA